jgi:hypothetical protein
MVVARSWTGWARSGRKRAGTALRGLRLAEVTEVSGPFGKREFGRSEVQGAAEITEGGVGDTELGM